LGTHSVAETTQIRSELREDAAMKRKTCNEKKALTREMMRERRRRRSGGEEEGEGDDEDEDEKGRKELKETRGKSRQRWGGEGRSGFVSAQ
jgi:hypothetical protein